ncbi:phosphoprotein phosphatase [Aureococcus anophagefferens]|nr:phosphoprotein phosphatase [Aureococcus anophagefferens]
MDPCFAGRDVAECIGGSLFAAGSPEFDLAETVVDNAISLLRRVAGERKDEPDLLWHPPHLRSERAAAPSNPLHAMGGLASGAMGGLAHAVGGGGHRATRRDDAPECLTQTLLGASDRDAAAALTKTLFRAFRDLLLFFVEFGCPSHRCGDVEYCEYVFNGDWVDRGHHQLECVLLLAALKVRYPRRIHLNRGNHESAEMNAGMSARGESGFDADVRAKLGEWAGDEVFKVIQAEFFHWLPVATVIESAVLVVHGGIGDGKWTLGDLSWQLLWSDPDWRGDGEEARGVHESERGLDVKVFGPDVSRAFCHMNGLKCVVRSHEYVPQGVMIQHGGYLATVFSARDYDYHDAKDTGAQNDGAIIAVTHDAGADRDVLRLKAKIIQKTGV